MKTDTPTCWSFFNRELIGSELRLGKYGCTGTYTFCGFTLPTGKARAIKTYITFNLKLEKC